jgi:excinuclease UvrABC nuclease subunit
MDLAWSPAQSLGKCPETAPEVPGVYRLLGLGDVVYLGESKSLKNRMQAHASRFREQAIEASWVEMPNALPHHLKERETDLIGAFFSARKVPPRLQYAPSW